MTKTSKPVLSSVLNRRDVAERVVVYGVRCV